MMSFVDGYRVTALDRQGGHLAEGGSGYLADGVYVVAIDPSTQRTFYPVPSGETGAPIRAVFHSTAKAAGQRVVDT